MKSRLYFAYGSNLSLRAMKTRCPDAVPCGKFKLLDSKLVFRGVADCVFSKGDVCWGGLWKISAKDEATLDRCEGVSKGFYAKEYVEYGDEKILLYRMNSEGIFPPSRDYFHVIKQGYRDFKLSMKSLNAAVHESWDKKAPSHWERQRYRRTGRPQLVKLLKNDGAVEAPALREHMLGGASDLRKRILSRQDKA